MSTSGVLRLSNVFTLHLLLYWLSFINSTTAKQTKEKLRYQTTCWHMLNVSVFFNLFFQIALPWYTWKFALPALLSIFLSGHSAHHSQGSNMIHGFHSQNLLIHAPIQYHLCQPQPPFTFTYSTCSLLVSRSCRAAVLLLPTFSWIVINRIAVPGQACTQIDHIVIRCHWRGCVTDCKSMWNTYLTSNLAFVWANVVLRFGLTQKCSKKHLDAN